MALHPCPDCGRHVRHSESRCPFCGAALSAMSAELAPVQRVTRAAMILGAALTASAMAACDQPAPQSAPSAAPPTTVTPSNTAQAPQVLPTTVEPAQQQPQLIPQVQVAPQQPTAQQQIVGQPDLTQVGMAAAARYGAPPVGPDDHGAQVRRYGAPPRVDPQPGPNDPGAHARRYGAPAFVEWDEA